jgi:hypothetical protein
VANIEQVKKNLGGLRMGQRRGKQRVRGEKDGFRCAGKAQRSRSIIGRSMVAGWRSRDRECSEKLVHEPVRVMDERGKTLRADEVLLP